MDGKNWTHEKPKSRYYTGRVQTLRRPVECSRCVEDSERAENLNRLTWYRTRPTNRSTPEITSMEGCKCSCGHRSSTISRIRCAFGCRYRVVVLMLACPRIVANVAMSPWFFARKRVAKLWRNA